MIRPCHTTVARYYTYVHLSTPGFQLLAWVIIDLILFFNLGVCIGHRYGPLLMGKFQYLIYGTRQCLLTPVWISTETKDMIEVTFKLPFAIRILSIGVVCHFLYTFVSITLEQVCGRLSSSLVLVLQIFLWKSADFRFLIVLILANRQSVFLANSS